MFPQHKIRRRDEVPRVLSEVAANIKLVPSEHAEFRPSWGGLVCRAPVSQPSDAGEHS